MMLKDYKEITFAEFEDEERDSSERIIRNCRDIGLASCYDSYASRGVEKKFSMDSASYKEKELKTREEVLAFACKKSGIKKIENKQQLADAFSNPMFVSVFNSIFSKSILGVVTNVDSKLLMLANIDTVDIGGSMTYTIPAKGLPIAQRASYSSNVNFLDGMTEMPMTIVPKLYTVGASLDYIRILSDTFDFGKEIAKIAMSLVYAQYKLVSGLLFDTAKVTGTPLYQATFDANKYTTNITYLQALNKAYPKAYGTLPAFQKQGSVATTNYGFQVQDEMIRNGMLGHAYGVDNIVIDQATDLSIPFIDANIDSLMLIPNNKILLISDLGDKPVKLVRENFIKVLSKDSNDGSLFRQTYTYTMAFDAGIVTAGHYSIQGV